MAERTQTLSTARGGINRLRTKGAASKDVLYDLINGYVTEDKTVVVRPGTFRDYEVDPVTKGLCAFEGELHVFADELVEVPEGFALHIITHPDASTDVPIPVDVIEFAAPFMGYLYVVGTFTNGDTWHFWLQSGEEWEADTVYKAGDIVVPSVLNGLSYQATRLAPPSLSWAASVLRAEGDIVEPTVYNDFYYTVVDVQGTNPRSGTAEPTWPTEDGAQVIEDADGSPGSDAVPTEPPDVTAVPNPTTVERYEGGV